MADPVVLEAPAVWLGGYDITTDLSDVEMKAARAELADPRFGNGVAATYPGIQEIDANVNGIYNPAATGADGIITSPRVIATTPDFSAWPLTVCPPNAPTAAAGADGNVAYTLRTAQFGLKFGAEHGQLLPFYLSSRARTGLLTRDTILLPKATYLVTTTGTAWQVGAVTAAQKVVVTLHVFAVTGGGTWTATLESDNGVGFATPIVRATFTGATAITRQVIEVAGAITDDWWRIVFTKVGGTSASAAALMAIVPA